MIGSADWLGARSVIIIGDSERLKFNLRSGIVIPDNVYRLVGINDAIIEVTGLTDQSSALSYRNPDNESRLLQGINLRVGLSSNVGSATGFKNFNNLIDCSSVITNNNMIGTFQSFDKCSKLYNCSASGDCIDKHTVYINCDHMINCLAFNQSSQSEGYVNCKYLTGCSGTMSGSTSSIVFIDSSQLSDCLGYALVPGPGGMAKCYDRCDQLVNCFAKVYGIPGNLHCFYDCSYLSNCHSDGKINCIFLSGANTKVDPVTVVEV